ncbi:hypothetical protein HN031_01880 [Nocardioides sp. zg-1308]|nr:hypothetical protein [Nocardioides sp. zg-1308]NPD03431.1 hypothetical protein [Nocardioides sp. zg-1308]
MSRILLIPVAVVLAAGGVLSAPSEAAPPSPTSTSISSSVDMGIQTTNR